MSPSLQTMGFFMSDINFCNTKEQLNHLGEVVTGKTNGSPSGSDISTSTLPYTGQVRKTLPALEAEYTSAIQSAGGDALNGGVWASGQTFTAYNQYMVYSGVPYKPKTTTTLPYGPTGATPDFNSVQPYSDVSSADVTTAQSQILEGSIFPIEGNAAVNDVISTPSDYIRFSNKILRCAPKATGTITQIDENTATIGGVSVVLTSSNDDLSSSDASAAYVSKRLSDGASVVFSGFGDSTMWGAEVGNLLNQDPNNPLFVLSKVITDLYGPNSTVNNFAISGSAMFQMMAGTDGSGAPFEDHVKPGGKAASSDVIFCNHGVNDCQTDIDVKPYKDNYIEFVKICRSYKKVPVLVTPNQITPVNIGDQRETRQIQKYVQAVREVAEEMNCPLVDQFYYFEKTATKLRINEIIGDGVHPKSNAYLQAGKNLAIPFVSFQTVSKAGDMIYPSSATYLDSNAMLSILDRGDTSFGIQYTSTRTDGVITGTNLCSVFDNPIQDISFNMLQWSSGSKIILGSTLKASSTVSAEKIIGNRSFLDWDSDFSVRINAWAGLNILSFAYDPAYTVAGKNQMSICGLTVPNNKSFSACVPMVGDVFDQQEHRILSNRKVNTRFNFVTGSTPFTLVDGSGAVSMDVALLSSGDLYFRLFNDSGQIAASLLSSGVTSGDYDIEISIDKDNVSAVVGNVSASISLTPFGFVPPLWVSTRGFHYTVSPTISDFT